MAAEIMSLAQQSRTSRQPADGVTARDREDFPERERGRLSAAQGVALGVCLSLPVWAALGAIVYLAF